MDLVTLALAKKMAGSSGGSSGSTPSEDIIPSIGENGNWYIKGRDTGVRATPLENVEVDGILKADSIKQNVVVVKDGTETIVGEFTSSISLNSIDQLFEEG